MGLRRKFQQCGGEMTQTFQREIQELDRVFRHVEAFVLQYGVPESVVFPISVAVEELFCNAVRHNRNTGGQISIDLTRRPDHVRITFEDAQAPSYDIGKAPVPDVSAPLAQRPTGKLGLHLVRKLMDKVEYAYADGCNVITLTKLLRPEHV